MKKITSYMIPSEYMVMFLRTFAFILLIVVIVLVTNDWEKNNNLVGALGILVSALLASYSVILNIDINIKMKNVEHSNKVRSVFFQLCLIKMKLISLKNEEGNEKISYLDYDRFIETLFEINNSLSKISTQDLVSIMHNKILQDLHFLQLNLALYSNSFTSMAKNTKRPDKYVDGNVVPNPLKILKLDGSIKLVTNILIYLKKGYEKEFPEYKSIEMCAEYENKI